MTIVQIALKPWRGTLKMKRATARATFFERRGFYLHLKTDSGLLGLGEISPLPHFSPESRADIQRILAPWILATGPEHPLDLNTEKLAEMQAQLPASLCHGFSQAYYDLLRQMDGEKAPQNDPIPLPPSHHLIYDASEVAETQKNGPAPLKIKVGIESAAAELQRLTAIRRAAGPQIPLRLDANGAWSLEEAITRLKAWQHLAIQLIEDPIREDDFEGMATLKALKLIPIAADAGCRSDADLQRIIAHDAADIVVLKGMLIGSQASLLQMARRAHDAGLGVMLTTSLDSPLAQKEAQRLARLIASSGPLYCGLNTIATPQPPKFEGVSLPNPLASSANAMPDTWVLITPQKRLTFDSLRTRASQIAHRLAQLGFDRGDKLAILGPATAEFVEVFWGIRWLGARAIPLDHQAPAAERTRRLKVVEADALIHLDDSGMDFEGLNLFYRDLDAEECLPERPWSGHDIALTLFSSGSTGQAKAIPLTVEQLHFSALGSAIRLGHHLDDRWLCALPLHHIGGLSILLRTVLLGTCALLWPKFDAQACNRLIDGGDITQISLVPTMFKGILADRGEQPFPPSLRLILLGGAPADQRLLDRARALNAPICQTWGMTECGSQICTTAPQSTQVAGVVGPPLPFARVEATADGLEISGPIAPNSPFKTKDFGQFDGPQLKIGPRLDRLIISGGKNIDPREIEGLLEGHGAIAEAYIFARPHEKWGQRPWAAIVLKNPQDTLSHKDLEAWLRGKISRYKWPDAYLFWPALPKSPLGKVLDAQVRAQAEAAADSDSVHALDLSLNLQPQGRTHASAGALSPCGRADIKV